MKGDTIYFTRWFKGGQKRLEAIYWEGTEGDGWREIQSGGETLYEGPSGMKQATLKWFNKEGKIVSVVNLENGDISVNSHPQIRIPITPTTPCPAKSF